MTPIEAEQPDIDTDWFRYCVLWFAEAKDERDLMARGRRLAADKWINQATKDALRGEFREQLKRVRVKRQRQPDNF